jgi:hypothetical protein
VPVTVAVWFPFFAVDVTVAVNVTLPPAATGVELSAREVPVKAPPEVKLTVPEKPPIEVTLT